MRIFKSEVGEMKNDGKPHPPSAASSDTVRGETVRSRRPVPTTPPRHAAGERPDPHASRPALGRARPRSPQQQPPA